MEKLQYRIKSVYGIDRLYPANGTAASILKLTGKKTLEQRDLDIALELGFISEQVI